MFDSGDAVLRNGIVGQPAVTVKATVEQILAVSELKMIGGGLVPDDEIVELKRLGVHDIVGQDATPEQVVTAVRDAVEARRAHA